MRVDLPPHEATEKALKAGSLFQAGFTFTAAEPVQTPDAPTASPPLRPPELSTLAGVSVALINRVHLESVPPVSGLKSKARATLDALHQLKQLEAEKRDATEAEKRILAGFSGFGPLAN